MHWPPNTKSESRIDLYIGCFYIKSNIRVRTRVSDALPAPPLREEDVSAELEQESTRGPLARNEDEP